MGNLSTSSLAPHWLPVDPRFVGPSRSTPWSAFPALEETPGTPGPGGLPGCPEKPVKTGLRAAVVGFLVGFLG